MSKNVNIFISDWSKTGQNVSMPQFETEITFNWTDKDGIEKTHTETVQFPNILNQLPAKWVGDKMKEFMLEALRLKIGVDD